MVNKGFFPQYIKSYYLMLTEKCPLRCKYCYINDRANGQSIDISTIDNFMRKLDNRNRQLSRIIFFGGEPLLEIDKMKYVINNYGNTIAAFQVVSSGIVNIDKFINEVYSLCKNKFEIQISWDGNDDTRVTENNISVNDIVKNKTIKFLLDNHIKFQVRTVINELNIDNFYNIYRFHRRMYNEYKEYYADFTLAHQPYYPDDFGDKLKNQLNKILDSIVEDLKYQKNKPYIPPMILSLIYHYAVGEPLIGCNVGMEIIIRPNGDIFPCTMLSQLGDRFKMGNVNTSTECNNEIIDELLKQPSECSLCEYSKKCLGGCKYEKIKLGNSIDYINKNYCIQAKVLNDTIGEFVTEMHRPENIPIWITLKAMAATFTAWRICFEEGDIELAKQYSSK